MAGPYSLAGDTSGLPHTQRHNIPYEIESVTPRANWAPRASQQIIVARVLNEDADQFVSDMVGRVYMGEPVGSSGTSRLRRDVPELCPFYQDLWCTRCEQVEQGGNEDTPTDGPAPDPVHGWPQPGWLKFRCTFEGMPFPVLTDAETDSAAASAGDERELFRYLLRSRKPKAKEQQVPGGGMKVVGDPTTVLMNTFFKRIIMADVQYTHYRLPVADLPTTNYDACLGNYNSALWDFGADEGYSWPTGTLLYLGYDDTDKYWDANGTFVADVVHFFEYRSAGWNFFLTKTGAFVEVSSDGTGGGTKPYSGADFNTLFQF